MNVTKQVPSKSETVIADVIAASEIGHLIPSSHAQDQMRIGELP
jgi:hypothetical protein